jgi:antitoxin ChpS
MHFTTLRKVGGSVMLAVPPAILDLLQLKAGSTVGLTVNGNRLVVERPTRPKYTLEELLAQCRPSDEPISEEDRLWIDLPPVGREL